jgi:hypothetical protein
MIAVTSYEHDIFLHPFHNTSSERNAMLAFRIYAL